MLLWLASDIFHHASDSGYGSGDYCRTSGGIDFNALAGCGHRCASNDHQCAQEMHHQCFVLGPRSAQFTHMLFTADAGRCCSHRKHKRTSLALPT